MSGVPPDALLHAGTVVAAYVDSDEDSCPDDPLVSRSMRQQNATLVMFRDPKEVATDGQLQKRDRAQKQLISRQPDPWIPVSPICDAVWW